MTTNYRLPVKDRAKLCNALAEVRRDLADLKLQLDRTGLGRLNFKDPRSFRPTAQELDWMRRYSQGRD
jgi:hypothetical protein